MPARGWAPPAAASRDRRARCRRAPRGSRARPPLPHPRTAGSTPRRSGSPDRGRSRGGAAARRRRSPPSGP